MLSTGGKLLCYGIVLLAYLPGLTFILFSERATRHPVLALSFLGLFVFHALGSIGVLYMQYSISGIALISSAYLWMLVAEALEFYLVAGPYVYFRHHPMATDFNEDDRTSGIFRVLLLIAIVAIIGAYYLEVRHFLLFDLVAGKININTVLPYRLQYSYGLPNFNYYRLGFLVLPAILAGYTVIRCTLRRRFGALDIAVIIFCFIPQLLLAEKSSLLHLGLVILIALAVGFGLRRQPLYQLISPKIVGLLFLLAVPTVVTYVIYEASYERWDVLNTPSQVLEHVSPAYRDLRNEGYSTIEARQKLAETVFKQNLSPERIMENLWPALGKISHRLFVVYSEALALSVPFVEEYGKFGGVTLPTVRGLLPHKQLLIEVPMHIYAFDAEHAHQVFSNYVFSAGAPKLGRLEWFSGSMPVSALAEGYINFGWAGFLLFGVMTFASVILVQEILWRLPLGLLPQALMAWYGYLAVTLSMHSVFQTFISLIHTGVLLALAGTYWAIAAITHHAMKRKSDKACI